MQPFVTVTMSTVTLTHFPDMTQIGPYAPSGSAAPRKWRHRNNRLQRHLAADLPTNSRCVSDLLTYLFAGTTLGVISRHCATILGLVIWTVKAGWLITSHTVRVAKYCDDRVCLCVSLSVREHISGTVDLHEIFCVYYLCPCLILLWRRCDMLCTSGFMDDVILPHNEGVPE